MKKYAITNFKGGIGKTTIAYNLAFGFSKICKILLVDLDQQNDSSLFLSVHRESYNKNVFDDLLDKKTPAKLEDCIIQARENLYIIPNGNLKYVESQLHQVSRIDKVMSYYLKDLESMDFDIVLFDTCPTRTRLLDSVLCFCDGVLLPVQLTGGASIRSIANFYSYLSELYLTPDFIKYIIPNMLNNNTKDSRENYEFLKDFFKDNQEILLPAVPQRTSISVASKQGLSIFEYDKEASNYFMEIMGKVVSLI